MTIKVLHFIEGGPHDKKVILERPRVISSYCGRSRAAHLFVSPDK